MSTTSRRQFLRHLAAVSSMGAAAPLGLIIAPTRELVQQIAEAMQQFAQFTPYKIATVYGGVKLTGQSTKLRAGVDILVATPGRLKEHVELGNINLAKTEFVVLDEADRMMDMGQAVELERLYPLLPSARQTVVLASSLGACALTAAVIPAVEASRARAMVVRFIVWSPRNGCWDLC